MKVIFDETEYDIRPLTISQYQRIKDHPNLSVEEVISLFTDLPVEDVRKSTFQSVKFVASILKNHLGLTEDKTPLQLITEFNGVKYGLIIPSKISFEEWINLEVFFAQQPLNLSLIAAHLYKPLVAENGGDDRELIPYDMTECMKRAKEFEDFPVDVFLSSLFFFTTFLFV
jgi:hypothetical protein